MLVVISQVSTKFYDINYNFFHEIVLTIQKYSDIML